MEAICYSLPIRPGRTDEVRAFCRHLMERSAEVEQALANAGLTAHALVVMPTAERDYLLVYSKGANLSAATVARLKSELPIDQQIWGVFDETLVLEEGASLPILAEWTDVGLD